MFSKHILAAALTAQPFAIVADALDFDGTNDYLSRSSDLTGNADGKTFTFSAWVWVNNDAVSSAIYSSCVSSVGSELFYVGYSCGGGWTFTAKNSANTVVYNKSLSNVWPRQGWNHLLLSVDLTNSANHFVFINDIQQAGGFTTYTNDLIDFTNAYHSVGAGTSASNKCNGRISNVFLDYTYRNLSVEANRRLFITADRKPAANQAALNPILYLPLSDPTQAGKNLGTGGDFALTGVVARSGRGPNQFNAAYSDLDGSADYLSRTSALAGVVNGKQLTIAFDFTCDSITNTPVIHASNGSVGMLLVSATGNISCFTLAGSPIFNVQTGLSIVIGRNYHVVMSFDLADAAKRFVYINGIQVSATYSSYNNTDIPLASCSSITVGRQHIAGNNIDGRLGNVFFDTKYIDLSQPANLAKFVAGTGIDAKPVDLGANGELPFGTPPLIYLPMYGNNAGKNYGTGGDFTVNSGPFTGARGPNEFWGNKAVFNGTAGRHLRRTSTISGISNGKSLTFVAYAGSGETGKTLFSITPTASNASLQVERDSGTGSIAISARNSAGTLILNAVGSVVWSSGWLFISIDLTNSSNRCMYKNDATLSPSWTTYVNDNINFQAVNSAIAAEFNGSTASAFFPDYMSELYFATEYIDFSQEANRLKFRDAFGNPVDLSPQIQAGTLPNPAIYMRFDPVNFGKNSGTGGDFTVSGTITDGGQL